MAEIKNITKQINMIKKDDSILHNAADTENHVVGYYESFFSYENNCVDNGLIEELISPMVYVADNIRLTNLPSVEEIKQVVFSVNSDGALGPDGIGASNKEDNFKLYMLSI